MFGELAAKQIGLLHELVPVVTLIAYLVNPGNPITERNVRDAVDAAQKLGEKIEIVHASSEAEIDAAFDTCAACEPARYWCSLMLFYQQAHRTLATGMRCPPCIRPASWSLRVG